MRSFASICTPNWLRTDSSARVIIEQDWASCMSPPREGNRYQGRLNVKVMNRKMSLLVLLGGIAGSLLPFPSEVSPAWQIQIVDTQNAPVVACRVIESWAWWPLDRTFQSATLDTDAN